MVACLPCAHVFVTQLACYAHMCSYPWAPPTALNSDRQVFPYGGFSFCALVGLVISSYLGVLRMDFSPNSWAHSDYVLGWYQKPKWETRMRLGGYLGG